MIEYADLLIIGAGPAGLAAALAAAPSGARIVLLAAESLQNKDIAERVGVTKGTVYVYFPTKEELFSAMILHIAAPLETVIADIGEIEGKPAVRLEILISLNR